MINWAIVQDKDRDYQVDTALKCLVADIPFSRKNDHHSSPVIRQMIKHALAEVEIPRGAVRVRFCENGTVHFSIPDEVYPTGSLGRKAFSTTNARVDTGTESSEDEYNPPGVNQAVEDTDETE